MPLLDTLKDSVTRVFPRKDAESPVDTAPMGYGNSLRPFEDDMIISKPAIVAHTLQAFFSFLAMACFASLAAFQAKFGVGPSGLTGFAIFITVTDLVLALFLMAIPVIYDKYNKFNRLARAMKEDRVQFILIGTGAITSLLLSFIVTISAWTEPGCKNPDNDPNAKLGDAFKNGLSGWCSTKKAGAVFLWIAFAAWTASTVLAFLDWRSGKSRRRARARDPPFTHPNDPSGYAPSIHGGLSGAEAHEYEDDDDEDEEPFSYPGERRTAAPVVTPPQIPPFRGNSTGEGFGASPFGDEYRSSQGAVPGGGVGGFQPPPAAAPPTAAGPGLSRTMQYADPYAAIKANLASGTAGDPAPEYSYGGYR